MMVRRKLLIERISKFRGFHLSILGILSIVLIIFLLPFPQRIERTLYGAIYSDDVVESEEVVIVFRGYCLNYLIREDRIDAELLISDYDGSVETMGTISCLNNDVQFVTLSVYCNDHNHYVFGTMAFNVSMTDVVLEIPEHDIVYVATEEKGGNLQKIADTLGKYLLME